ncbi:MAG: purine-binding chemotaxis protein CheW [Magnetococcales bacterium]|nr:purine-binding chemotaxis protein CheW [Magnetococcales bacterium]
MPDANERLLRRRAERLAIPEQSTAVDPTALTVVEFLLDDEHYAIELRHIREIVPFRELTPVPGVQEAILGVVNLRGEIVALLDLRRLFALSPQAADAESRLIVLRSAEMEMALLADQVVGVRVVTLHNTLNTLPTLSGYRQDYLLAITPERMTILDGGKILSDPRLVVG